jgi:hypothetical protein
VSVCAHKLLGSVRIPPGNQRVIPLAGIRVKGIHVGSVHIGHVEVPALHIPNLHVGSLNIPPIHVTTPSPGGGASSSGEPPTKP